MDEVIRKVEAARARRPEDHRRHVHLHRGRHRLRRLPPALGARRRPRRALRAPGRPGRPARGSRRRSRPRGRTGRTSAPGRGLARAHAAARVQDRGAEAPERQDPGRGRAAAGQGLGGDHPGSRSRGPHARGRRVLPDVRGERAQADPAALGVLRLRRGVHGDRGRVPEVDDPPARLRQLRAPARQLRARREAHLPGGSGAAAVRPARHEPGPRSPRPARGGDVRGRRGLRPR